MTFWQAFPLVIAGWVAAATLVALLFGAVIRMGEDPGEREPAARARMHDGAVVLTFPRRLRAVQDALDEAGEQVDGEVFPLTPGTAA